MRKTRQVPCNAVSAPQAVPIKTVVHVLILFLDALLENVHSGDKLKLTLISAKSRGVKAGIPGAELKAVLRWVFRSAEARRQIHQMVRSGMF